MWLDNKCTLPLSIFRGGRIKEGKRKAKEKMGVKKGSHIFFQNLIKIKKNFSKSREEGVSFQLAKIVGYLNEFSAVRGENVFSL